MALTRYRSVARITTPERKATAYERVAGLVLHAIPLGYDVLRIQYMSATQYIEVDTSEPLSAAQQSHLGIEPAP